jgi:hypothetical protein
MPPKAAGGSISGRVTNITELCTREECSVRQVKYDDLASSTQGLGGGVRSHMRTRLHRKFPAIREKNREFCEFGAP